MVQVPVVRMVTVATDNVQTGSVLEAKATVSPEVELAEIRNGAIPRATLPSALKVIVCASGFTVKLRMTGVAAA